MPKHFPKLGHVSYFVDAAELAPIGATLDPKVGIVCLYNMGKDHSEDKEWMSTESALWQSGDRSWTSMVHAPWFMAPTSLFMAHSRAAPLAFLPWP